MTRRLHRQRSKKGQPSRADRHRSTFSVDQGLLGRVWSFVPSAAKARFPPDMSPPPSALYLRGEASSDLLPIPSRR